MTLIPKKSVKIVPATLKDLAALVELTMDLFRMESDFEPNREKQEKGLRLILEEPQRGRIFVLRSDRQIIGMVNLLFTISTAMGGFVLILEDFIIHPDHRGQGYGARLMEYVIDFARKKDLLRITLLTDKLSEDSQHFFRSLGFRDSAMIPMRLMIDGAVPQTFCTEPQEE